MGDTRKQINLKNFQRGSIGMSKRTICPDCQAEGKYKKNVGVYEDGKMWCFRCEKMINNQEDDIKQSSPLLLGGEYSAITKKRLTLDSVSAFNVEVNKDDHGRPVLVFPYTMNGKLIAQKLKIPAHLSKSGKNEYVWLNYNKKLDMFGSHLHDSSRKNIIITEGEEDAIAVYQALGSGGSRSLNHVTSVHRGTTSSVDFVKDNYEKLAQYETITLCLDEDDPGHKARDKVIPLFTKNKLRIVKLPRKDACEMLINNQEEELKWSVLKAEAIVPKGVVKVSELDREFFNYEIPKGIPTGFPKLDKLVGGIRKGELTMVTGGSGLSKSTFVTNLVYNLTIQQGLKVADIKLEENKHRTIANYLGMYFDDRKYATNPKLLSDEQITEFKDKFKNYMTHDHFGSLDTKELLSVLEYYALSEKVDLIVLDHISIAISGMVSSKEGERKDIDIVLTKIRELVNISKVGFICISHLSSPPHGGKQWEEGKRVSRSSLRGSASLNQLPDNILAIEGDLTDPDTKHLRHIRVLKSRYDGAQEELVDSYTYDTDTGKIHAATGFELANKDEDIKKEYF